MKAIVFAGGQGKRLWPISRKNSPKQFQKFIGEQTSLEHSFETLSGAVKAEDIYISTNEKFVTEAQAAIEAIPNSNIIPEPVPKDTGPALIYAMLSFYEESPDEPIVIRWQNSIIRKPQIFHKLIRKAEELIANTSNELVFLGVPSLYPNTGVGYIKKGEKYDSESYMFGGFVEKPDIKTATEYHETGQYSWNPGCYITTPRFIYNSLRKYNPELFEIASDIQANLSDSEYVARRFNDFDKESIDYALWEKLPYENIAVVEEDYGWHYVSTWVDTKKALQDGKTDKNISAGNHIDIDSQSTLVLNNTEKQVVTIGLENTNVIVTDDAILVLSDDASKKVRDVHQKLKDENLEELL